MGLTESMDDTPHLKTCEFKETVRDVLELLYNMFHDSDRTKERYGCRKDPNSQHSRNIQPSS
jgi:hypothetical protein